MYMHLGLQPLKSELKAPTILHPLGEKSPLMFSSVLCNLLLYTIILFISKKKNASYFGKGKEEGAKLTYQNACLFFG